MRLEDPSECPEVVPKETSEKINISVDDEKKTIISDYLLTFLKKGIENKKDFIIDFLEKNSKDSGIIYCLTIKTVDNLY